MDKFVKVKAGNQNGESSKPPNLHPVAKPGDELETSPGFKSPLAQSQQGSAPITQDPLDRQEEEPHATHSFTWRCGDTKSTTFTCNKAGTVEDSLNRSPKFKVIAKKNQNKELVIVKDGKAVSSHFPCSLIKDELLTVKYVKAVDKLKPPVSCSVYPQRKGPSGEVVMFDVLTKGDKNIVNIMTNPALRKFTEITVYAYKGEKVKQALKRDDRFLKTIFKKNCELSNKSTAETTEMSDLVDDLDGKTFKITLINKLNPPNSQPGSLDDAYMMQNRSQISDSDGNRDTPQQSSTTESVNDNTPPKLNGNTTQENILHEIPDSEKMLSHLFSQFEDLVKGKKTQQGSKLSHIQSLFRVEYGKNAETCREVKMMKKLMDLSNSVCQVRINGRAKGSGFLLFDKFVLTNYHVIRGIYDQSTGQLNQTDRTVTVHFSFESLNDVGSGVAVVEVTAFEFWNDESGNMHDWALLRLWTDQNLPDALSMHFGFLPQSGGICIIGHPDGGVKKIDPCLIIPTESRNQVVERHWRENPEGVLPENPDYYKNQEPIQVITHRFFEDVAKDKKQALNYESCFYFGSSGSPVFDEHCNAVAMHTGGYVYRNGRQGGQRGEVQSVIEYGCPLSVIIERMLVQLVGKKRFDVLNVCGYAQHHNMMTIYKKLNPSAFSDENWKMFFESSCKREETVPMDTD